MATLYGNGLSPFVRKVRVVLAEKNVAHEHDPVVPFNVSAEYKAISPLGKIPAYRDEKGALPDSSVISAYLEKRHPTPALYPIDPYEYARARSGSRSTPTRRSSRFRALRSSFRASSGRAS